MTEKGQYGLLVDYQYCSGCHACEVACKKEHDLPKGDFGIKIVQDGPRQCSDGVWEYDYLPVPTHLCDLCAERVKEGRKPACVHHCLALCMEYGTVEEMAKRAEELGRNAVLFVPRVQGA